MAVESSHNRKESIGLMGILNRVFKAIRRIWFVIPLLVALGAGLSFFRAWRSHVPMYQSSAIISVTSGYSTGDIFSSTTYYDSAAAQQMAETFPYLITADMTRDLIVQKIGSTYYEGTLYYEALADTNLLQLTVRSRRPEATVEILEAIIECYPQVAVYMVDNPQLLIRQAPRLPQEPYNHFSGKNAAIKGGLAGLALAAALIALQAMLIQPIASAKELKKIINLPLLTFFPHVKFRKGKGPANRVFITGEDDMGMAESIRTLRTKTKKLLEAKQGKIVLLTSTIPGEGKSTISANLALSLASEGRKVVLVDADLRNQTIFRMFADEEAQLGLMDCLNDPELDVVDCLHPAKGSSLLYLSGSSIRKRHYSLDARALRRTLDRLLQEFDYVVMDTPPCAVVSDTALLCRFADVILYVIRQDYANQYQILDGVTGLHERGITLSGCVLNDVDRSGLGNVYGYGMGYGGYGYGSKYGQKKKRHRHSH